MWHQIKKLSVLRLPMGDNFTANNHAESFTGYVARDYGAGCCLIA